MAKNTYNNSLVENLNNLLVVLIKIDRKDIKKLHSQCLFQFCVLN